MQQPRAHKSLSDEHIVALIDKATKAFVGNSETLASAIGTFMIARKFGWKPIFLMRSRATLKTYEGILGIDFREVCPEVGPFAKKSVGWTLAQKVTNFWKAVKGELPNIKSTEIV